MGVSFPMCKTDLRQSWSFQLLKGLDRIRQLHGTRLSVHMIKANISLNSAEGNMEFLLLVALPQVHDTLQTLPLLNYFRTL